MENNLSYEEIFIWQDREIRFDVARNQLALRQGEKAYDTIANVEDTKGNNGDVGTLIFTNLRLIWYCQQDIKINLSVGYDCVLSTEVKSISSKSIGETKALAIKCKFNSNRFEFVFNSVNLNSPFLFSSFQAIHKSYDTSRLYRDIKLKGFLTNDKNLISLPNEKIASKIPGVSSVNNDQAVTGTFIISNVRMIWFSTNVDNFNVSLPWIQIKGIKIKELPKNGKCIAIEAGKGTANIFYFKFSDSVDSACKDLENNYRNYTQSPVFGVDLSNTQLLEGIENKTQPSSTNIPANLLKKQDQIADKIQEFNKNLNQLDDVEVIETNFFNEQANMIYYMTLASDKKNALTDINYSLELGLAMERLPENVTLNSLWRIIPN